MKRNWFVLILIIALNSTVVQAQNNLKLYDVSVSTGESALSSGLDICASFLNADATRIIVVEGNAGMGQIIYMQKISKSITVGPTAGFLNNAIWMAPIVTADVFGFIKLTTWNGVIFGKPNNPDWKINYGFSYQAIDLKFGRIGAGCSLMHVLMDKPMTLPYIKYELPLNKENGVVFSVTYNIRDDSPMFLIAWHHIF